MELDLELMKSNPLANGLLFKVTIATHSQKEKPIYLETVNYTKIFQDYQGLKDKIYQLKNASRQIFDYILLHLEPGEDYIYLNKAYICGKNVFNIKSAKTYRDALKELELACIIARHPIYKDIFWINPNYIFCGSRPNKFPDKMIVK